MEYLGFIGGILTTAGFIPQVIKSYRTKSVDDVSLVQPTVLLCGMTFWLAYGIYRNDYAIILANFFSIVFNWALVGLKIKYRKSVS